MTLAALPAAATLVTPISVSLIAGGGYVQGNALNPTPINASQNLSYTQPITPSGGAISPYMITGEVIELAGDTIHFRSYVGDNTAPGPNNLRTGLLGDASGKARYVLNGLDIAGRDIVSFVFSTLDVSGAGAGTTSGIVGGTTFLTMLDTDSDGSLDQLTLNLEDLRFVARQGVNPYNLNFGDITVTLISRPTTVTPTVPEPSSVMLCFAALAGLGFSSRARNRAPGGAKPPRDGA